LQQFDFPWFYRLAWGGGALLLVLSAWLWWSFASVKPYDVFWGTINNSLATSAVSKQVVGSDSGAQISQKQHINLGRQKVVSSKTTIQQGSGQKQVTIQTESIATPTNTYSRYTSIKTQQTKNGRALNFGPLYGVWGQQAADSSGNGLFAQAIYDIVPLANLLPSQRQTIIKGMKTDNVYTVDYNGVKKHRQKGRLVYDYSLSVAPAGFMNVLQHIDQLAGLQQLNKVDVSQYQGSHAIKVTVSVDARLRQLLSISYQGSSQTDHFLDYGQPHSVTIPTKTIPQSQLQERLNTLLAQSP
jgi:hypothetical protein